MPSLIIGTFTTILGWMACSFFPSSTISLNVVDTSFCAHVSVYQFCDRLVVVDDRCFSRNTDFCHQ
ncbi:hypothetical protein ACQ86N_13545 [Puia sp. P3]|uniref:hypothetical protein n=1 Tax=Puia sp. P3 TaxID=3423952 RepID=UPI003D668227